jgi:hypothetical protein
MRNRAKSIFYSVLFNKFHPRTNLTALLVTILGSRNKNKHSEFWYLKFQRYLLYKFRLKTDKPWVFLSKFRCRTILMHFLLHTNMWQVYTRPTSASDFFLNKYLERFYQEFRDPKKSQLKISAFSGTTFKFLKEFLCM